jgi:hypothetical protein
MYCSNLKSVGLAVLFPASVRVTVGLDRADPYFRLFVSVLSLIAQGLR